MNELKIFFLHNDPVVCAEMHNDKHCIKMILESCQLLSTAHRILDGSETIAKSKTGRNVKRWILNDWRETTLYSATHIQHPSAVWCRQTNLNYIWLANLTKALCREYTYRYGKIHKCEEIGLVDGLYHTLPKNITFGEFTQPTPAMPDAVKIAGDSLGSYRNYYIMNKKHLASWQGKVNSRPVPSWYALT
jgi:hypothetical protein